MARFGYARVSTEDQNLDLQIDALKAAGFDDISTETASGKRTDRPVLDQLLARLRPGDVIGVWKLDRLGRNLRHLIHVMDDLNKRRVDFRSLIEGMDTTTATGRLLFNMIGSLAQFERDMIAERTTAGVAAARRRGRTGGNPGLRDRRPDAIAKLRAARVDSHFKKLLATVDFWLPKVKDMRPGKSWDQVVAALNDLSSQTGQTWTERRLIRSVRYAVAGGLVDRSVLERSPSEERDPKKLADFEMAKSTVCGILSGDDDPTLGEVARRLEASGCLTSRGKRTWSIEAAGTLIRHAVSLGKIEKPKSETELRKVKRAVRRALRLPPVKQAKLVGGTAEASVAT